MGRDELADGTPKQGTSPVEDDTSGGFTPGPWNSFQEDSGRTYAGPWVVETSDGVEVTTLERLDNDAANARLIAAAPDLLAALQHILAGALSLPRFAEDEGRAAIAKAIGHGHEDAPGLGSRVVRA